MAILAVIGKNMTGPFSFKDSTNAITIGSATDSGAWTFGTATAGNAGTFKLNGTVASSIIHLQRVGSDQGSLYINTYGGDFRLGKTDNGTEHAFCSTASAWTFGSANAALTHTFHGSTTNFNGGTQTSNGINISYSSGNTLSITGNTGSGMFAGWSIYANNSSTFLALGSNNNQIRFYTGAFAGTQVGTITSDGAWTIGASGSTQTHTIRGALQSFGNGSGPSTAGLFNFQTSIGTSVVYSGDLNSGPTSGESTSQCALGVRRAQSTGRSINAAGTINASGADYAEYMVKARPADSIQKGEVCGVDQSGKLTKKFSESVMFVVKSTDPSYVGGDTWFTREQDEDESYEDFIADLEAARSTVDRIAFCGQVPCVVSGSFVSGDWVVASQGSGDSIIATAISDSNVTFAQYKKAVGQVIKTLPDGKAFIMVGIK